MISALEAVLTAFFGFLFLLSGLAKLRSLRRFRDQIVVLNLLPHGVASVPALLIPSGEAVLGAVLLLRWRVPEALAVSAALLTTFSIFVAWALATRRQAACFCFGEDEGEMSRVTLLRNLVLVALAASAWAITRVGAPPPDGIARATSLIYAAAALLLFLSGFRIAALRREADSWA